MPYYRPGFFRDLCRLASGLIFLATVCGYCADWHRLFELTCHFKLQYLGGTVICVFLSCVFRDWRWVILALVGMILNAAAVLPWYIRSPKSSGQTATQPLRLLLCNVYTPNLHYSLLLNLIQREQPDLIVLEEVDPRWMEAMQPLQKNYPFSKWIPRDDNFGIALLSRIALLNPREIIEESELPTILADFNVAGQKLSLIATHPLPPASAETFSLRNTQLSDLAELARQTKSPVILLGDLNVTLFSPYYGRLVRSSGLQDARHGHGILPTWPTFSPFLMIPLDQCLVSPSLKATNIRTGSKVGSDHLPLIVDLAIPVTARGLSHE